MSEQQGLAEPKKRGRKKVYEVSTGYERGAPRFVCRMEPELLEYAEARPEGKRAFVEGLIRGHKDAGAK